MWRCLTFSLQQSHLPTMLHVLRFVHADGQLDLQLAVCAAFRHRHLMQLRLFGTVGRRVKHNLRATQQPLIYIHKESSVANCTKSYFHNKMNFVQNALIRSTVESQGGVTTTSLVKVQLYVRVNESQEVNV